MTKLCKRLGIEIPEYNPNEDPTKTSNDSNSEWTLLATTVKALEKVFNAKQREASEKRKLTKNKFNFFTKKEKPLPVKKRKLKEEDGSGTDV